MHPSARRNYRHFVETYLSKVSTGVLIEIGAQDVNGGLRDLTPGALQHVGVDFASGVGVDVVLQDPYTLPFESGSADVVVSSSCFEHSEFFWLLFLEVSRLLKPGGLFYLNVPSNGYFHRFPVDCWRLYPDAGLALSRWGLRNGHDIVLLESFTTPQDDDVWNDFVAVFGMGSDSPTRFPERIIEKLQEFWNGRVAGSDDIIRERHPTEDMVRLMKLGAESEAKPG
jgi:SAM-dependent methyltransferase